MSLKPTTEITVYYVNLTTYHWFKDCRVIAKRDDVKSDSQFNRNVYFGMQLCDVCSDKVQKNFELNPYYN